MYDYTGQDDIPWNPNDHLINKVNIGEGVTTIGAFAFYECGSYGP